MNTICIKSRHESVVYSGGAHSSPQQSNIGRVHVQSALPHSAVTSMPHSGRDIIYTLSNSEWNCAALVRKKALGASIGIGTDRRSHAESRSLSN